MKPGDLIRLSRPSFSHNTVCLWSGPEHNAWIVERIPVGVVTTVIAVLTGLTVTGSSSTQLLVVSPNCRLGYVSSLCVEGVDT